MPDGPGRPTVMTDTVLQKLELGFMMGYTDVQACFFAGIAERTLYEYESKNPEYSQKKKVLKSHLEMRVKTILSAQLSPEIYAQLTDADMKFFQNSPNATEIAKWWAERKLPGEFGNKTKVTIGKEQEVEKSLQEAQNVIKELRGGVDQTVQAGQTTSDVKSGSVVDLPSDSAETAQA